jgi:predicted RNase H-like HicB family nuclease
MAKFTAVVEQAEDGTWTAYTVGPTAASGTGLTREEALLDLERGMAFWLGHLRETGQAIPQSSAELVTFEAA